MNVRAFFLQLFCGAAGGYIAGAGFSRLTWGTLGDLLIGVAGGAAGGQIFEHLWAGAPYSTEMALFLASTIGGCIGGAFMLVLLGSIKLICKR